MGIRNLNKFLRTECKNSIKIMNFNELSNKKIVVDISIYLHKFEGEGTLIESIYLMLTIFKHYNIIPIFIFDGKPPTEKNELLKKRRDDKKNAEKDYNDLKVQLHNVVDEYERQEIIETMDILKKQLTFINKEKVNKVKDLIRSFGATYYDAPFEADELCAFLVLKKKVDYCLSEDMDLFVYGCPRVLRYLSMLNHSVVCYDLKGILVELGLTQNELREICVLSGTDYNLYSNMKQTEIPTLEKTLKYFKKYYKEKKKENTYETFYQWLSNNSKYIEDVELLERINIMFNLCGNSENHNLDILKPFEKIKVANGPLVFEQVRTILSDEGFIFPV